MAERMMIGVAQKAVETLRNKFIPSANTQTVFVPQEEYRGIFDLLEVWDKETADPDIQDKTKFIFDSIKEKGEPKEQLVTLFSTMGATPQGDTKLNRVYRYLKLQKESEKVKRYYDTLTDEMRAINGGR